MTDQYDQVKKALSVLKGFKMSVVAYAGNMREFGFGELRSRGKGTVAEYSLHVQCPWRILCVDRLVTGSGDWYFTEDPDDFTRILGESWDPALGGSLQEAKLRRLFQCQDTASRVILNHTEELVVKDVNAGANGAFSLFLSPDYELNAIPVTSREEYWRLFQPGSGAHFVVGAESCGWE